MARPSRVFLANPVLSHKRALVEHKVTLAGFSHVDVWATFTADGSDLSRCSRQFTNLGCNAVCRKIMVWMPCKIPTNRSPMFPTHWFVLS